MKSKRVWRFWCDHCNKAGLSRHHMERHERVCTKNPARGCNMCGRGKSDVAEAVKALGRGDLEGVEKLRDEVDSCPACMLAAIVQSGLQPSPIFPHEIEPNPHFPDPPPPEPGQPGYAVPFDYKAEKEDWWAEVNAERAAIVGRVDGSVCLEVGNRGWTHGDQRS